MTVSDDVIFDYLGNFTDGTFDSEDAESSRAEFRTIMNEVASGKISPAGLMEVLRREILAQKMQRMDFVGNTGLNLVNSSRT